MTIRIALDYSRAVVEVNGKSIPSLTHREFRILEELKSARGRILSRGDLMKSVWGYDADQLRDLKTRTLDVHIVRLRSKIKRALRGSRQIEVIKTVPLRGYKLNV